MSGVIITQLKDRGTQRTLMNKKRIALHIFQLEKII